MLVAKFTPVYRGSAALDSLLIKIGGILFVRQ